MRALVYNKAIINNCSGCWCTLQDLREVFDEEAKQTRRRRLLLTVAAAGGSYFINAAYEPRKIIQYVIHTVTVLFISPVKLI